MASTATAQQHPPQQPPPQQQKPSDQDLITAILAAFLTALTAAAILARLRLPMKRAGIGTQALQASIALVLSMPQIPMEGIGPATRWAVETNEFRRAAFMLNTCKRVQAAIDEARAHGEPILPSIGDALRLERNWFAQHVAASHGRIRAAAAVDGLAHTCGDILGWQAIKDKRCTPGCRFASGKNFSASHPPMVEGHPSFPGAVHGATCRCRPCPPFPGAPVMQ